VDDAYGTSIRQTVTVGVLEFRQGFINSTSKINIKK
jgi:hypothetical protein